MRSYRLLFTLPLWALALALSTTSASAQPVYKPYAPANYKAPKADLEKWATRLKQLCPPTGWTVKTLGNDVLIQRDKPVNFRGGEPMFREGIYRIRLRFAPAMTLDKYEKLVAENFATEIKKQALLDKHELFEMLGEYVELVETKTLEARKQAYFAASKTLTFNLLPDFYTPDASLTFYHSWQWFEEVSSADAAVKKECDTVMDSLIRSLGAYEKRVGTGQQPSGDEEPTP